MSTPVKWVEWAPSGLLRSGEPLPPLKAQLLLVSYQLLPCGHVGPGPLRQLFFFFRDVKNPKCVCATSNYYCWHLSQLLKLSLCQARPGNMRGLLLFPGLLLGLPALRPQNRSGTDGRCGLCGRTPRLRNPGTLLCTASPLAQEWFSMCLFLCQWHSWEARS